MRNIFKLILIFITIAALTYCGSTGSRSGSETTTPAAQEATIEAEAATPAVQEAISEAEAATPAVQEGTGEADADTPAAQEVTSEVESGIQTVKKYGNIVLTIKPERMKEMGFEPADMVNVRIGEETVLMPIGTAYSDVDSGEPVCCFRTDDKDGEQVVLAINAGNFISSIGVADIQTIDADPGYEVLWKEGFDESTQVYISMAEKQGYAQGYLMHQLTAERSNVREDYPDLSDAEYANFREVQTTGLGIGALYRTSSPIDPALNRNKEADEQIGLQQIHTILNLANKESEMKAFPDYDGTNYSKCDVIALNMGMDFFADEFREKMAEGLRFMADHEGPYLIHCKEGKDRTGFLAGILSAFMGADITEIVQDYMLTYYNFNGITPESSQYAQIADSNIKASLAKAFGLAGIEDAEKELSVYATAYLKGLGLSEEEIAALKTNLGKDR